MAAIYARVSSEQQREEKTIASQTASLIEFAKSHDLEVPAEWVFEDEGFSGAVLERPGLERVRDLAAEGQIQVVLAYSPDRLSRKYAYQILLMEEFARQGVETLFVNTPQGDSAEEQLLVQLQGMIAEYERAQILERSRRGKRHRAQAGEVSVMCGAPYGYRYMRKTDQAPAAYIIEENEARVVQRVYEMYTVEGLSIAEVTRRLNSEGIPTRKRSARWERSVVWAILRNPTYRGAACFGKTRASSRTRVMRPQRRRGVTIPNMTAGHERPREEWIEIPVPALVGEQTFARAQELLQENRIRSRRRTIEPSVVQGMVSCAKCGYAFARSSTHTTARKLQYYKCIGSDSWRKLGGPVCDNRRMVRQDLLDQIVWAEVIRLLEDPALIQQELDRRLVAARTADPTRKREQSLQRELTQVGKSVERLLNAYQEGLVSIEQLRWRMPALRQRERTLRTELQAIADQTADRDAFLRLAETLTAFLVRLRQAAETLDVAERQRIVRLVVKEVLVGDDTITIRHSIPIPSGPPQDTNTPQPPSGRQSLLLCKGSERPTLRRSLIHRTHQPVLHHARGEERSNQLEHPLVRNPPRYGCHQLVVVDPVEKLFQIQINHPAAACGDVLLRLGYRLMCRASGPEPVTVFGKPRVPPALQDLHHRLLNHAVQHRRDAQLSHPSVRLGYLYPLHRMRLVCPTQQLFADGWPVLPQVNSQRIHRHAVDARAALVGLHSLQGLQTVLSLADLFHQLFVVLSRAFDRALRRERFGPFARSLWSFTPPLLAKGQPKLVVLPLAAHRVAPPTCRFLPFGPSPLARLLCPLLTSAPRSEWIAPPSVPIPGHGTDLPR
ncbi:MAG TPA: recombinase family protein [Silvibacterium sp.]|nr:recombinase family protein [Silvibacterium sp.]